MTIFHAITDVGCRRKINEDALLADAEHGLFVVADGVGGRDAGELASAITIETFQTAAPIIHDVVAAFAEQPSLATRNAVLETLDETCQEASHRVFEAAEAQKHQGMTTTVVAVAVGGGSAFVAHVGDSRAYLVREGEIRQITEDHSMVNEMIRTGQMSREEASRSRYRNVITRAVGLHPTVQADVLSIEILPGDRVILNSDGLTDVVPVELAGKMASSPDIRKAAQALIDEALTRGAPDNVTAIVIEPDASAQAESAAARARIMESLFLFENLPYQARLRVSRICDDFFFTPGQTIVAQLEAGDTMYVVVQGEVTVTRDDVELAHLGPGEHFGEIALADQLPRSATVTGSTYGSLITIRQENLVDFCRREPDTGNLLLWKLLRTLGSRLRDTNARLAAVHAQDVHD
jgi:PPM family protein phosphatase